MIRIERGGEVTPGVWLYVVPSHRLCGRSRQPLLDACRQLKRMGVDPLRHAAVFNKGGYIPAIYCTVQDGAELTVAETRNGPRFKRYRPFAGLGEAAAEDDHL